MAIIYSLSPRGSRASKFSFEFSQETEHVVCLQREECLGYEVLSALAQK